VLYIDDDWWQLHGWDTQMMDVEPLDEKKVNPGDPKQI
jgi:hypothetical protein